MTFMPFMNFLVIFFTCGLTTTMLDNTNTQKNACMKAEMYSWTLYWTSAEVQTSPHHSWSVFPLLHLLLTGFCSMISVSLAWLCSACFSLFPLYGCLTVPIHSVPWVCYVYSGQYSKMVEHQWFRKCKHVYKHKNVMLNL